MLMDGVEVNRHYRKSEGKKRAKKRFIKDTFLWGHHDNYTIFQRDWNSFFDDVDIHWWYQYSKANPWKKAWKRIDKRRNNELNRMIENQQYADYLDELEEEYGTGHVPSSR